MEMIIAIVALTAIIIFQTMTISGLTTKLMARNLGEYNQIVDKQIETALKDEDKEEDTKYVPINDAEDIPDPVDHRYQEIK